MFRRLLLVGVALIAAAAGGDPVRGVVLDAFDQPVAGAVVRLRFDGEERRATSTATDGTFAAEFDWTPAEWKSFGALAISPAGAGMFDYSGPRDRLDEPVILRLAHSGTVGGTIVGPGAVPLPGAVLELVGLDLPLGFDWDFTPGPWSDLESPLARIVADPAGRWSFEGVPRGMEAQVRVRYPGLLASLEDDEDVLRLGVGDDHRLVMHHGAGVTGRVIDPSGRPVAGLTLTLDVGAFGHVRCRTGPDGRYAFTNVTSGWHDLYSGPDAHGRVIAPQWVEVTQDYGAVALPDLIVAPGRRLRGLVSDAVTGRPIPGCRVTAESPGPPDHFLSTIGLAAGETSSDASGGFELVVPRTATSAQVWILGFYPSHLRLDADRPLPQLWQARLHAWDQLEWREPLDGVVVDEAGDPIGGAIVSLGGRVTCDADGRFRSQPWFSDTGLPEVSAWAPGYRSIEETEYELPADGPLRIVLEEDEHRPWAGKVVDRDGQPLAGALVLLHEDPYEEDIDRERPRPSFATRADAEGRYAFARVKDRANVDATAEVPGYRPYEEGYAWAGDDATAETIVMEWCDGRVAGTVVDLSGRPVAGARVYAQGFAPDVVWRTGADGRFLLRDLPAGPATVEALSGEHRLGRAEVEIQRDSVAQAEVVVTDWPLPTWGDPGPAELQRARALLRQAWDLTLQPAGGKLRSDAKQRDIGAALMVLHNAVAIDPKVAWELALWVQEPWERSLCLLTIFDELAASRPEEGWAQRKRLELLEDAGSRVSATARLGLALVADHPDRATELYEGIRDVELDLTERRGESVAYADRAVLALKLGQPEADTWIDALLRPAHQQEVRWGEDDAAEEPVERDEWTTLRRWGSVRRLARVPQLADRVLEWMRIGQYDDDRTITQNGDESRLLPGQQARIVQLVAERDPLAALGLFNRFCDPSVPLTGYTHLPPRSVAAELVAAVAKLDPGQALVLARRIPGGRDDEDLQRGQALATVAARIQDPDLALQILREAKASSPDFSLPARLAADLAPGLAASWVQQQRRSDWPLEIEQVFNLARLAPNMARHFCELQISVAEPKDYWSSRDLIEPALTLLPIDPERALSLIDQQWDKADSCVILCAAARWLMLEPGERRVTGLQELQTMAGYDWP